MTLLSRLLPLAMLFIFLIILCIVAFIVWSIVVDVTKETNKKMEKNNVSFSQKGVTISVKEINDEDYKARTQSVLVDMWNKNTSIPALKYRWRRK